MKNSKVSIKTRSTPVSLSFKGQASKHTTVKWSIERRTSDVFLFLICIISTELPDMLQCHQSKSDHFLEKNTIVVCILIQNIFPLTSIITSAH